MQLVNSVALQVVQRNLRKYVKNRNWAWFRLWQKVKPLLNVVRVEDVIAVSNIVLNDRDGIMTSLTCQLIARFF